MKTHASWSLDISQLQEEFQTDLKRGLDQQRLEEAKRTHGPNILVEQKKHGQLKLLLKQFHNTMSYMLLLAAAVSFALDERIDAIAILSIVLLNGVVGFIQEAKAEASIAALKKLSTPKAKIIREGKVHLVDSKDVVPGDLLSLEAGDYIVADAVVIDAYQLSADEAVLTGESMPVEKNSGSLPVDTELGDRANMLHASTAITTGSGKALVVATGMNTEIGKIAGLLDKTESEMTPLQKRLGAVSNKLLVLGGVVMVIVALIGILKGWAWLDIFMYSISLAVAAIPEGLPTIVTLALALAVRRMSRRKAIVRKLASVETLGSTNIICTDKTGTLTTGDMTVREEFTLNPEDRDDLYQAAIHCNNASLDNGGSGDPTEIALLKMAGEIKKKNRVHEWSFDSQRKRMSVAVETETGRKIYSKGAPEAMLPLCQLTHEEREKIQTRMTEFAGHGRRTLALATRDFPSSSQEEFSAEDVEQNLHFLGLVAMADPPKEETIPSIKACRAAGIKVIMITGDHPLTAGAIAKELGITKSDSQELVMTGTELENMSAEELRRRAEKVLVYARVSPEHKLKIVEALQKNGHTVAMTGDGVNDAPALKKASIGVAMGRAGTEVARQASSIILTDDNFSTIVSAVEEGRAIFGNIKRTIQYLLSTNLAEILIVLGAALSGMSRPFVPIALLWINLVTDGFPSLALAAEPVEKDFLAKNKEPSPTSFFNPHFMKEMFIVALMMTIIELGVYGFMIQHSDGPTAKIYAFNLLVYLCLFRSFSCRSETRTYFQLPFNRWHVLSILVPIVLQLVLENTKLFQDLFEISSLSLNEHLLLIGLGTIPVGLVEIRKLIHGRTFFRHHKLTT